MTDLITHVHIVAALTAAVLLWACLDSALRCHASSTSRSSKASAGAEGFFEFDGHGTFHDVAKGGRSCEVAVICNGTAYELNVDSRTGKVVALLHDDA